MNTEILIQQYKNQKIGNPESAVPIHAIKEDILSSVLDKLLSKYDLDDEIYATKESVFFNTRRIVARNPYNKIDKQLFTSVDFDDNIYKIVKPIIKSITLKFSNLTPVLIQLATLLPGQSLKWHVDVFLYQQFTNKLHIPIFTNPNSYFDVYTKENTIERTNMQLGSVYNINNLKLHRSINKGDSYRTHLIIDFIDQDVLESLIKSGVNFFHTKIDAMSEYEKLELIKLENQHKNEKLIISTN